MNVSRIVLLAVAATALGVGTASADGDGQDNSRIQNSIYDLIQKDRMTEGRGATDVPPVEEEPRGEKPESYYFDHPTQNKNHDNGNSGGGAGPI